MQDSQLDYNEHRGGDILAQADVFQRLYTTRKTLTLFGEYSPPVQMHAQVPHTSHQSVLETAQARIKFMYL